jgi:hypothetical protein
VGFGDSEPAKHVREQLLVPEKDAFFVSGFDADDFFVTLAQRLGCFPPECVGKPFSHLDALLENVSPYTIPGQPTNTDVVEEARKLIQQAIRQHEEVSQLVEHETRTKEISVSLPTVLSDLMVGDYEKVIASLSQHEDHLSPEFRDPLSWAFVMQGNALSDQAQRKEGAEADQLFTLAGEKYQAALTFKPDKHEALNNWGNALLNQAQRKEGAEADQLLSEAKEKLLRAEAILPGASSYNLACICAIRGEEAACREWLEQCRASQTLPTREHLMSDRDLDNVRGQPWFKAIIEKI